MMEGKQIFKEILELKNRLVVGKNQTADPRAGGYSFRGIDDIYNEIKKKTNTDGIFTIPELIETREENRSYGSGKQAIRTTVRVKYTIYALDGSNVSGIVEGSAMDTGDKSMGQAFTMAHKTFLIQLFGIPTDEKLDTEFGEQIELVQQKTTTTQPQQQSQPAKDKNYWFNALQGKLNSGSAIKDLKLLKASWEKNATALKEGKIKFDKNKQGAYIDLFVGIYDAVKSNTPDLINEATSILPEIVKQEINKRTK